jgi:hypothetical protein
MKKVYVRDKNLESYDISNLKLSILLSQDGLSYSLMSVSENKYVSLISFNFSDKSNYLGEIEGFLEQEKITGQKFFGSVLMITDSRQTLIPDVLFEKGTEKTIWELNFMPDKDSEIRYFNLTKSSNVVVYPVRNELVKLVNILLPDIQIISACIPFIESNFTRNKLSENNTNTKVFVQVFEEYAELLILNNAGIKLFNTFGYKTNNDLLYSVINVFEQLKLSRENSEVVFSGFIETDNLTVLNLRKFIGQVCFESQNPAFKYFYKFQEIAPHYFYNFLNI